MNTIRGKPTSLDIAHLAGVSQPTVSRALRGSPMVNEETRKRILAIAEQLNYKVDKNASNLRAQQTGTLALLLFEDPTSDESHINPFFLPMLGSITRTCARHGKDLLISFQQLSDDWHAEYGDSHKADGLILLGYGDYLAYQGKLKKLVEQGTPFVRWGAVIAKNLFGVFLVCLGLVLSLPGVPGQGILTILLGLIMLDIPGKRPLEARIIKRPAVLAAINDLRARFKKPPLVMD